MLFASDGLTFNVTWAMCSRFDCIYKEVTFRLVECDPRGQAVPDGRVFSVTVALDTGTELHRPDRSSVADSVLQAFLLHGRQSLFASILRGRAGERAEAKRIAEYVIDRADIESGNLIPYTVMAAGPESASLGGTRISFFASHNGKSYYADDLHCPKPDCPCQEAVLLILGETVTAEGEAVTGTLFDATITTRGKITPGQILDPHRVSAHLAREILKSLRAQNPNLLRDVRDHRRTVKEVATRSLRMTAPKPSGALSAIASVAPPKPAPVATLQPLRESSAVAVATRSVGRNDPCPCQSGKKFKKCCGN
jgi:hypothetical protein